MKIVILDTDFILNALENHIDIENSIKTLCPYKVKIAIMDKTLNELENKIFSEFAKRIVTKFPIITTKQNKTVDDLIVDYANKEKNIIVAPQDRDLKERLKKGKTELITIRQQKQVILV